MTHLPAHRRFLLLAIAGILAALGCGGCATRNQDYTGALDHEGIPVLITVHFDRDAWEPSLFATIIASLISDDHGFTNSYSLVLTGHFDSDTEKSIDNLDGATRDGKGTIFHGPRYTKRQPWDIIPLGDGTLSLRFIVDPRRMLDLSFRVARDGAIFDVRDVFQIALPEVKDREIIVEIGTSITWSYGDPPPSSNAGP